jgi:hypothetical protein
MAGMGKPPSDNARHSNPTLGSTAMKLPASGRKGTAPKWPLPGKPSTNEAAAWKQAWTTPQAVGWEQLGWVRPVARYVRCLVAAEEPGAPAALLGEVRQMEDRLGLSPMALLRLRWSVVADELADAGTTPSAPTPSSRARLRVVS